MLEDLLFELAASDAFFRGELVDKVEDTLRFRRPWQHGIHRDGVLPPVGHRAPRPPHPGMVHPCNWRHSGPGSGPQTRHQRRGPHGRDRQRLAHQRIARGPAGSCRFHKKARNEGDPCSLRVHRPFADDADRRPQLRSDIYSSREPAANRSRHDVPGEVAPQRYRLGSRCPIPRDAAENARNARLRTTREAILCGDCTRLRNSLKPAHLQE